MLFQKLQLPRGTSQWLECLLLASVYIATARLGQLFAMEPGNITPVWLPSGIMLAVVLLRGEYAWPGIFLGALLGNGWAYIDVSSLAVAVPGLLAASANGVGDVICTLLAARILKLNGVATELFSNLTSLRLLIVYGVILGPLISAVFGVGSLTLSGIVPLPNAATAFFSWWLGDGVGVLLLTPAILAFHYPETDKPYNAGLSETLLYLLLCALFPLSQYFGAGGHEQINAMSAYMTIPILLWGLLRLGLRAALLTAVYYVTVELVLAKNGKGYFWQDNTFDAVMDLQFFILTCISSMLIVGSLVREREKLVAVLKEQALLDGLTGINNRQAIENQIHMELRRQKRYQSPFVLIMLDIDFFKKVNDDFGHQVGDEVLKGIASYVKSSIRDADTFARWGGEEFMLLMPATDEAGGVTCAQNLCTQISRLPLLADRPVTVSLGVVEAKPSMTLERLISGVDSALYVSKKMGRNRVSVGGGGDAG